MDESFTSISHENSFLLENIQGGIVYSDYDPPFHLRYVTEGMTHLSGYTQEQLLHMEQMQLVHEDDIEPLSEEVGRQFALGDTFEVEYRLKRSDGTYLHVLDRAKAVLHEDGRRYIHCLLTDITDLKEMELALQLSQQKYKLAIQQGGNVILDYDLPTHSLTFSENYPEVFGSAAPEGDLLTLVKEGWTTPDFEAPLIELFQNVAQSKKSAGMELEIHTDKQGYMWCSLHLTPVTASDGKLYALVACLRNIDKEKRHLEVLTELSQKDGLTGVYNRATMEQLVNEYLGSCADEASGAMMVMDIDCFKSINDRYGHAHGDDVLIKLSRTVEKILPDGSLLGRLGGDEFLIFVPGIDGDRPLSQLSQDIVEGVRNSFADAKTPLTVSLGAAPCDADLDSFTRLYRDADCALYESKKRGRNDYTILGKLNR